MTNKTEQELLSEGISSLLGIQGPEVRVGMSIVGHVHKVGNKFRASSRVADPLGKSEIDKLIGDYDSHDEAVEKVLTIRNMNLFALPKP